MSSPKETYDAPEDEKALVAWLEQRYTEARRMADRSARLNLAYVKGHQHVRWDERNRRLDVARASATDRNAPIQITVNKIGSLVERVISRLTKSAPVPECRPVTSTETDVSAARVGSRILDHEMHRLMWPTFLTRFYFWVTTLGWSFVHVRWDPEAGGLAGDLDGEQIREGDIVIDEVPGTEIRIDPNARTWGAARWCIRDVTMTAAAIYETYGVTGIKGDNVRSLADESYALDIKDTGSLGDTGGKIYAAKVAVHQMWIRPGGRATPKGLVVTWTGSTILEAAKPFPFEHGQLPFIPFSLLPGIGAPEGRTWVDDLRPQQADYNDARSREATIRRELTPKVFAARGAIDSTKMSSRFEVIDYNPVGDTPQVYLPDGRWMAQYETAMNRSDAEMGDRAGQAEVSQGRAPAGAPAAAILALQEADESKLAISAKELASSTALVGFQILSLVRQFWAEDRVIRTWSQDGTLEVSRFSGANVSQQLDIHLTAESALPRSKAARAQLAETLWERGIINDPRLYLRMIEVPGVGFLEDELNAHAAQAERENGRLLEGQPVEVHTWHNHPAHIAKHNAFRLTEEYEQMPPELQQWFDGHVDAHEAALASLLNPQAPPAPVDPASGMPEAPGGGPGADPSYLDPMTGRPPDPLAVAAGQAPSALTLNPPPGI